MHYRRIRTSYCLRQCDFVPKSQPLPALRATFPKGEGIGALNSNLSSCQQGNILYLVSYISGLLPQHPGDGFQLCFSQNTGSALGNLILWRSAPPFIPAVFMASPDHQIPILPAITVPGTLSCFVYVGNAPMQLLRSVTVHQASVLLLCQLDPTKFSKAICFATDTGVLRRGGAGCC